MALYPLVAGKASHQAEDNPPDPAWPIEGRLDAFRAELYAGLAESTEFPRQGGWPDGKRFPLLVWTQRSRPGTQQAATEKYMQAYDEY